MASFFSGIGGFEEASVGLGFEIVQLCEIDPFGRATLESLHPGVPIDNDITRFNGFPLRGRIDIIVGGFPCQSASVANVNGKGIDDAAKTGLWRELLRVVTESEPRFCLFENVNNLLNRGYDRVAQDLDEAGYEVESYLLGADDIGATHRRKRIWIVAYNRRLCMWNLPAIERRLNRDAAVGDCDGSGRGEHSGGEPGKEELLASERGSESVGNEPDGWRKVVFTGDCEVDEDGEPLDECPECGGEYSECECPGPTMDGWEYQEFGGVLYAREEAMADLISDGEVDRQLGGESQLPETLNGNATMGDSLLCNGDDIGGVQSQLERERERLYPFAFPPAPEDYDRWESVARTHPHLLPCVERRILPVGDGVSSEVLRQRRSAFRAESRKRNAMIKALGNALVPACARPILAGIKELFDMMED